MKEIYKYLIENTAAGKIDKLAAVQLAKMLKELGRGEEEVAIIGMALQFPQSDSPDAFWQNLTGGADLIGSLSDVRRKDIDRLLEVRGKDQDRGFLNGGYLEEIDKFDHQYFGLSPREASLMDPNQRLFLETAWQAMEDAGYGGEKLAGTKTGVVLGYCAGSEDYTYKQMIEEVEPEAIPIAIAGNLPPIIASRLSYLLDLKGPNLIVDTACSSSLSAVHVACQMLRDQEADLMIVGGVKVHLLPFEPEQKIGIESSDGRTKTFDDRSDGTGIGEGAAAVLLKPLQAALRDGDRIYAVIKGSAANQDGRSIGITAPSVTAQEEVIRQAWKTAKVDPATIRYIEAHGTGTNLGDPIEIEGVTRAFSHYTERKQFCAIGSLKTNMGHLDSLAGLAGLIKTVLALKHRKIPASLHFHAPNRQIAFEESPVYVNDTLADWEAEGFPRRCGVSAFGMSGSNVHVVLEEAPAPKAASAEGTAGPQIFTVSAANEEALRRLLGRYAEFLAEEPAGEERVLADICYTASTGRGHGRCRAALIVKDLNDLTAKLAWLQQGGLGSSEADGIFRSDPATRTGGDTRYITDKLREGTADRDTLLRDLARSYVNGARVEWDALYAGQSRRKAALPVYPFDRTRCWLELRTDDAQLVLTGKEAGNYTETERDVASAWGEVLGLREVGIDDNFFDLGGNSLEGNILIWRLRKAFNADIPVSEIFKSPTVRLLSRFVETADTSSDAPIELLPEQEHYALSAAQKRLYGICQVMGDEDLSYNMPFAMRLDGPLDTGRLQEAWHQLIGRHETLRTTFEVVDGEPVQRIHAPQPYEIEVVDADEATLSAIFKQSIRPFDLAQGPLFCLRLIRLGAERHVLFFDMHHIVSDGVSVSILIKEWMELYQDSSLPGLRVQYKEYAAWQNRLLASDGYQKQERYWTSLFESDVPVLQMPTDLPRPRIKTYQGDRANFTIDGELREKLEQFSKASGVSLYAVLLGAYHILLARHSNQEDIVIGSPVAGRPNDELQGTVGMFVNMLPMRNRLQSEMTCRAFFQDVMSQALDAFEHQDFQIEELIEKIDNQWEPGRNPLFDAVFALQNMDLESARYGELQTSPIAFYELEWNIAKFDLSLFAVLQEDGIEFSLEYSTELFNSSTAQRLCDDYVKVLAAVVSPEEITIREIELGSEFVRAESVDLDEITFDF